MKRIFIAVNVHPGPVLLKTTAAIKALLASESIKWTELANTHLTLAFLGDTEEKRIMILSKMLREKCSGFGEFSFTLAGTGVFKNFRDPRVIWAGIRSSEQLAKLSQTINSGLAENDFPVEERPFKPHLTLGRIRSIKDPENLKSVIDRYIETEFQTITVNEVILYESILMQTGPVYKALDKYTLL